MAKAPKQRHNKEGEIVVGEDAHGIDILDVPQFRSGNARDWMVCESCGNTILLETNGKSYYHKLKCKFSNGIGYGDERSARIPAHHAKCDCSMCQPKK